MLSCTHVKYQYPNFARGKEGLGTRLGCTPMTPKDAGVLFMSVPSLNVRKYCTVIFLACMLSAVVYKLQIKEHASICTGCVVRAY